MDIYASDEEKGEEIKRWWRENGLSIMLGIALGIAVLVGGRYWLTQKQMQSVNASSLYQHTSQLASEGKRTEAAALVDKLFSEYASTPYAVFAALEMAKHSADNDDLEGTKSYLNWVITHAELNGQRDMARLRLGQLLLDQADYQAAQAVANDAETNAFESLFDELKGDIYIAQDQFTEAAGAYGSALNALEQNAPRGLILKLKLDDITGS